MRRPASSGQFDPVDSRRLRPLTQPRMAGSPGRSTRHQRLPLLIRQPRFLRTVPFAKRVTSGACADGARRKLRASFAPSPLTSQKSGPPERLSAISRPWSLKGAACAERTPIVTAAQHAMIRRIFHSPLIGVAGPEPSARRQRNATAVKRAMTSPDLSSNSS